MPKSVIQHPVMIDILQNDEMLANIDFDAICHKAYCSGLNETIQKIREVLIEKHAEKASHHGYHPKPGEINISEKLPLIIWMQDGSNMSIPIHVSGIGKQLEVEAGSFRRHINVEWWDNAHKDYSKLLDRVLSSITIRDQSWKMQSVEILFQAELDY